jgi:hypothetical protein
MDVPDNDFFQKRVILNMFISIPRPLNNFFGKKKQKKKPYMSTL